MDLSPDLLLLERCLSLIKKIVFPENSQYVRLERSSVKEIGADDSRLLGLRLPDSSCVIINYLSCRIWRSNGETILIRRCEDEFKDLLSVRLIARPSSKNKQYFDLLLDCLDAHPFHTRHDVCSVGIGLLLFTPHQMLTLFGNKLSTEQILREVLYRVVECPSSKLNTITGQIESKYNQSVSITVTLASSVIKTSDPFSEAFEEYISTLLPEEFEIPTIESDVIQYHQPKLAKYKKYLRIMTDFAGDRDVLCALIVKMIDGEEMTSTSSLSLMDHHSDTYRDLFGYASPYTYSTVVTAPHIILRNIFNQMAFNSHQERYPIERLRLTHWEGSFRNVIVRQLEKIRCILNNPLIHTGRIHLTIRNANDRSSAYLFEMCLFNSDEYRKFRNPSWYFCVIDLFEFDCRDLYKNVDDRSRCSVCFAFFTASTLGHEYIKTIYEENSHETDTDDPPLNIINGFSGYGHHGIVLNSSREHIPIIKRDVFGTYMLDPDAIKTRMFNDPTIMLVIKDICRIFSSVPTLLCSDRTLTVKKQISCYRFMLRPFYYMQIDTASSCTIGYILPYEIRSLIADHMDFFY